MSVKNKRLTAFTARLEARSPNEPLFHQAVHEILGTTLPWLEQHHPEWLDDALLDRITEPERTILFRVCWETDDGEVRVNRGYRVQFNSAIGPYKGGLRFHPSVKLDTLKFLGFEQTFKNALTGLPMGGGKGGSDFDPKGRSDREVMRFCQAFMTELQRHIGPDTDVPAGDIGVGAREIGYMYGQYRRIRNVWDCTLTGKGLAYGGSRIRPEATGYGLVYFTANMLERQGRSLEGMTCSISGSGNVAQYACEKLIQLGAKVVTMSDSSGMVHDPDGIGTDKLAWIMELKNERRGRIKEYADEYGCKYEKGANPWGVKVDWAFPCATQNEVEADDAKKLIDNGAVGISEGANMPCTQDAIDAFAAADVALAPAKAANAGGVGTSGLEMSQNSIRDRWSREEVDTRLKAMMADVHARCLEYGISEDGKTVDYVKGANVAGMARVAEAMAAYGVL